MHSSQKQKEILDSQNIYLSHGCSRLGEYLWECALHSWHLPLVNIMLFQTLLITHR
jgi:hypothetical protein